jgi:hypothetical protein
MTAAMTATNQRENMTRAKNKTPVTSVTLLTEMLRVLTDTTAPAGLDRMYMEMTALIEPDVSITAAVVVPADGEDTLNLSQLHIDEVIPPATRYSVDLMNANFVDLFGELAKPEPKIQRWLSHEIHRAELVIQNGQAVARCVAGTFPIDSVAIYAHGHYDPSSPKSSDVTMIKVRNKEMPAGVRVQFATVPAGDMPAVLDLLWQIVQARTQRRAELQQPHMRKQATQSAAMERAIATVGRALPEGRLAKVFKRKNGWADISHTSDNGKERKIMVRITDQSMRLITGHKFGNHKEPAHFAQDVPIECDISDMIGTTLAKIEQMDLQSVKQLKYVWGEAEQNGGEVRMTTAQIAAGCGITTGGVQWHGIETRMQLWAEIFAECVILGDDKKPVGQELKTPLLMRGDTLSIDGTMWRIPTILLAHVRAGYGVWQDRRALLLGTKDLPDQIATRMYWSATRYLSLNKRRGIRVWSPKVRDILGDQLGITAGTVASLIHNQKRGQDAVLDTLRRACMLLESFTHTGQTIRLVKSARIEGDTVEDARLHVVLFPTDSLLRPGKPIPALPA